MPLAYGPSLMGNLIHACHMDSSHDVNIITYMLKYLDCNFIARQVLLQPERVLLLITLLVNLVNYLILLQHLAVMILRITCPQVFELLAEAHPPKCLVLFMMEE